MNDNMTLHHVAYVTEDIERSAQFFCDVVGFRRCSEGPIDDPVQDVRIQFLHAEGNVKLELLEPLSQSSPVFRHLKQGGGLYHLCFETDDLDAKISEVQRCQQGMLVKGPDPAPAIEDRRVAFIVTKEGMLVEFVETAPV